MSLRHLRHPLYNAIRCSQYLHRPPICFVSPELYSNFNVLQRRWLANLPEEPTLLKPTLENENKEWDWIPPSKREDCEAIQEGLLVPTNDAVDWGTLHEIPVKKGERLTVEEVMQVIENDRGIDTVCVDLRGKSNVATYLVISTGKSTRHMHKIARGLIHEYKRRRLKLRGGTSARKVSPGEEDWVALDLGNIIVNLFLEEKRQELNLEQIDVFHWMEEVEDEE